MFVLLARDVTAEYFVAAWASVRVGDMSTAYRMMDAAVKALSESGKQKRPYTDPKLVEANCCSASMRSWRLARLMNAVETKQAQGQHDMGAVGITDDTVDASPQADHREVLALAKFTLEHEDLCTGDAVILARVVALDAENQQLQSEVAGGWRDISTAPKDINADVWAVTSFWPEKGERHANAVCRDGKWFDCGGNVLEWQKTWEDSTADYRKVTHWMRLPSPPLPHAAEVKPIRNDPNREWEARIEEQASERRHAAALQSQIAATDNATDPPLPIGGDSTIGVFDVDPEIAARISALNRVADEAESKARAVADAEKGRDV